MPARTCRFACAGDSGRGEHGGARITGSDLPVTDEDRAYFERRAEEEIERARESSDPRSVAIHYALSELYLERIGTDSCGTDGHSDATNRENEPIDAG